jgi:tetratricopeptide (TPR) repeat protein
MNAIDRMKSIVSIGGAVSCAWALAVSASPAAEGRPADILSWRHQILPKDRYQALAREWESYVGAHPRDARAWVEWGNALRYAGEWSAAQERYSKAYEVDSTDVAAVDAWLGPKVSEAQTAAEWRHLQGRLSEAIRRDPGYSKAYYTLWNFSLMLGDDATATWCLRHVVESGDMPPALFEFGANIVAGAPQGAIVFTNGDNDTYPCFAYQALTGERSDVSILNLSFLNVKTYVRRVRDRGVPIPLDDAAIDALQHEEGRLISDQVQTILFESFTRQEGSRPLCYSVTVPEERRILPGKLSLEGLVMRVEPGSGAARGKWTMNVARTRELFDTVYRTEGVIDPLVDWERESSLARLGSNYAYLLMDLGKSLADGTSREEADRYFYLASRIFGFQRQAEDLESVFTAWQKAAPGSRLLERARREHGAP